MTEVPEHLLARSRERRAALGLGGGSEGGGGAAPSTDGGVPAVASAATAAPAEAAGASTPAIASGPPSPAVIEEEGPSPVYLAGQEVARTKVPLWVMPVIVLLPFWGFLYLGAFGERAHEEVVDPLVLGAQVYKAKGCSQCHGGVGEGGVGPPLADGASVLTFPDEADHEAWIKSGSASVKGQPYGDPDREGGQAGPATGGMPGFPDLSEEELKAVVAYEREQL